MKETCRVCSSCIDEAILTGQLLGRSVSYFECPTCSYVQTQNPDWLDEAYASVINDCDTGIMTRNQACLGTVLGTLAILGKTQGRVVDCAGGYGILTRMLRDIGVDALWSDPYCQNLVAMGFEHSGEKADLVTAFEAFEHFISPPNEMERLFDVAPNLLISTSIVPTPTPQLDEWWYFGLSHGQHVGFMRLKTLEYLANRFDKHLVSDGRSFHLLTDQPVGSKKWMLTTRVARYFPRIFTRDLTSRTWSDFEKMTSPK
ncbi:MAG: class I SAM-dependent methyltransferase [Yoonia sp.]